MRVFARAEYADELPSGEIAFFAKQKQQLTMRQVHSAGDKLFVDYSWKPDPCRCSAHMNGAGPSATRQDRHINA